MRVGFAISESNFALAVIFSIIGSSLASIIGFYLIMRYRNQRKASKEDYVPDYNPNVKQLSESSSDAEFSREKSAHFEGGAKEWDFARVDVK